PTPCRHILHIITDSVDDAPTFVSRRTRLPRILEPGTPLPYSQIGRTHAATFQQHAHFSGAWLTHDSPLKACPHRRGQHRHSTDTHVGTSGPWHVCIGVHGGAAPVDSRCSRAASIHIVVSCRDAASAHQRQSASNPFVVSTCGRQPLAVSKRRVSET